MQISRAGLLKSNVVSYDSNHIRVYRMQETSGTSVNEWNGGTSATADSGLTITTGYQANKYARQFDGSKKISTVYKSPIGAKSIRFKMKIVTDVTTTQIIMDSIDGDPRNYGVLVHLSDTNKLVFVVGCSGSLTAGSYIALISATSLTNGVWYDVMCTWNATTGANSAKMYAKAISGSNTGKWLNGSGSYVDTMTVNIQGTSTSALTNTDTYNIMIGRSAVSDTFYLNGVLLQDVQISNIVRTDMKNYI